MQMENLAKEVMNALNVKREAAEVAKTNAHYAPLIEAALKDYGVLQRAHEIMCAQMDETLSPLREEANYVRGMVASARKSGEVPNQQLYKELAGVEERLNAKWAEMSAVVNAVKSAEFAASDRFEALLSQRDAENNHHRFWWWTEEE